MFGDSLREILQERNLTQQDLVNSTGIAKSTISRYLSNQQEPSLANAIVIASVLKLSVEELVAGRAYHTATINRDDVLQYCQQHTKFFTQMQEYGYRANDYKAATIAEEKLELYEYTIPKVFDKILEEK